MTDTLEKIAQQVPALSVLAFVVWMFLGAIAECEVRSHETHERLAVVLDQVVEELAELNRRNK